MGEAVHICEQWGMLVVGCGLILQPRTTVSHPSLDPIGSLTRESGLTPSHGGSGVRAAWGQAQKFSTAAWDPKHNKTSLVQGLPTVTGLLRTPTDMEPSTLWRA